MDSRSIPAAVKEIATPKFRGSPQVHRLSMPADNPTFQALVPADIAIDT